MPDTLAPRAWATPAARAACERLAALVPATLEEAITLQQIAAPTFAEQARAEAVRERFTALGLADVAMDEAGNVTGRIPGREAGAALLLSAHLDTVFPAETDLAIHREAGRLYGPGIGDNSLGVAGLLTLARLLREAAPRRDLWLAANVGEEGLGNLSGMWAVTRRLKARLGAAIVLEGGAFGVVIHQGIGVRRYRLSVTGGGGHAWSDFGTPSAIHELCRLGAELADLTVPDQPRTSYNLGTIEGGTSINTIAAHASALLDVRSEAPDALAALIAQVERVVSEGERPGVSITLEEIGNRPAGGIPADHPLVQVARAALVRVGCSRPALRAASTDANVPLALGLPAICIGLTVGYNAHRLDEFVETEPLAAGLQQCFLTSWATLEELLI